VERQEPAVGMPPRPHPPGYRNDRGSIVAQFACRHRRMQGRRGYDARQVLVSDEVQSLECRREVQCDFPCSHCVSSLPRCEEWRTHLGHLDIKPLRRHMISS